MTSLRRATEIAGANLIGLVISLSGVASVPALGAVVATLRNTERPDQTLAQFVLGRIRRTFVRDLPMSIALMVTVLLASSTVWALTLASGATLVALGVAALLWALVGTMLAAYAHAVGTLAPYAPRAEVIQLASLRLRASPWRGVAALLAVLVVLPLWLFAPAALWCGISLPAWVQGKLWAPVDRDLLVEMPESDD